MINIKDTQVALISDIHLGIHQDSAAWHDIALQFAKWLNIELKARGISDIIIPGDIFHDRSEISVNTISVAYNFFNILKDYNIIIIVGNHDCFYKDRSDVNSASILARDNIHVVDKLTTTALFNNTRKVTFAPWAVNINDIEYSDVIFGHFELNSFYHNNFKMCSNGVSTSNILDKGNTIITGHFHKTELRKYDNGQILYVGSPYQQTFADVGGINGCYIFNFDTLNIEEFIENTHSPKHFKIKISECIDGIYNLEKLKNTIPNNIILLIVDKQVSPEQANLFASKLHTLKPFSLRIDFNYDHQYSILEKNTDLTSVDIAQAIEEFVTTLDIDYKIETIDYLIDIYKQTA